MPSGRTHLVVSVAATSLLVYEVHLPPELVVAGAIGGLFPDSDIKTSLIGAVIPMWLITKHRGFTHSWMACFIFSVGVGWFFHSTSVMSCFALGYMTHLLLDWMTPRGEPLKWPKKKQYRLRRWK